jgi:hypothetical protein
VAHWRGENDFLDSAGTSHAASIGPVTFGPGMVGSAIHFPDAGHLEVAGPAARGLAPAGAFTIAAFVRVDGNDAPPDGGPGAVLSVGTPSATSFTLQPGGPGNMHFFVRNAAGSVLLSSEGFDAGQWRHVAVTYDPANRTALIYADGQRVMGLIDQPTVLPVEYLPGLLFHIGKDPTRLGTFDGLIDDLRFYNEALGDAQIRALAVVPETGSFGPLSLGLLALRRRRARGTDARRSRCSP